jgi:pimeloyl-ACP methyl ester carboxylesterase
LRPFAALAAIGGLLLGCSGDQGTDRMRNTAAAGDPVDTRELPEQLTAQRPDWEGCADPSPLQGEDADIPEVSPGGPEWECATLTVPVDYADPGGDTLDIAMIRAAAAGEPDQRIGSLIFNFGGPGGSGVVTLPAFAEQYRTLQNRYDLVSFDPRGVGESEGVVCLDDAELDDYHAAQLAPDDDAQARELIKRIEEFANACEDRAGDLLPYLTTANTARDVDLMRQVLGDGKLQYFGISYGTQLGGVYAHLFPERVGRAVFDAVVDPGKSPAQSALGQAEGFQLALGNYQDVCFEDDDCPLGGSAEEAERTLTGLLDRLEKKPMPTRDPDRPLTRSLAWAGIAQSLYSEDYWAFLTQGLDDALDPEEPDGSILQALGDAMNGRSTEGTYSTLQASLVAIRCADTSTRYTADQVRERLPDFEEASPVFGRELAWSLLGCTGWPVEGESEHPDVSAKGSAEILLIGTIGDPATPYEGTASMRDALGTGVAVDITYEGEGHGAYTSGDACIKQAANGYLLDGSVPEAGLTCG